MDSWPNAFRYERRDGRITTSLNRPRSSPFSRCIGKLRASQKATRLSGVLLSSPDRRILRLPFPRHEKSSPAREGRDLDSAREHENIGEKDERHFEMIGDESSNGIVDAIVRVDPRLDPRFLEEGEETREGEGKFLFELQLDKTFSFLSRGPGLSVGLSRRAAKRA